MNVGTVCALIAALAPAADPEVIDAAVQDWLDDHPEATTTVEDGSITEAKLATALAAKINGMDSDVSALKSAIQVVDPVFVIPDGYKSANYSNAAGTLQYKYSNGELILKKANGSTGEINTGNASLTIGDSLAYVIGSDPALLSYKYNNTNTVYGVARLLARYYNESFNDVRTRDIYVPLGEGETIVDLKKIAADTDVNLAIYKNFVFRGIRIEETTGVTSYGNVTAWIKGITGTEFLQYTFDKKIDNVQKQIDAIDTEVDNLNKITDASSSDIGKTPRVKTVTNGVVTAWEFKESDDAKDAYSMRKDVPSYYLEYPVNPVSFSEQAYLDSVIESVPAGKSFLFVTDTHWESNNKHTFDLMRYVKNKLGIKKVLFGGDCIDRGNNKYLGLNKIREFMTKAVDAFGRDFIVTIGNHDLNTGNALNDQLDDATYRVPYDQVFKVYLSHLGDGMITEDLSATIAQVAETDSDASELTGWSKLHYYVDDADNKTRYIVIYSSAYDATIVPSYTGFAMDGGGGPTTVMQYEWFASTLMSTPEGYDIIVLSHCADSENKTFPERQKLRNYFNRFVQIASAFHLKSTGYKIDISFFDETACPTNAFWTRETKTFDFTSAPDVGKILFLSGHIHKNVEYVTRISEVSASNPKYDVGNARNNGNPALVGVETGVEVFDSATVDFVNGEMLTIISQTDAYGRLIPEKYPYEEGSMTQNTITDQSFDVITLTDSGVVCTRFGAGWSRTIPVAWTSQS